MSYRGDERRDPPFDPDSRNPSGAIGAGDYCVSQGESIGQLAARRGFHPTTIWRHPENAELRTRTRSPDHLLPGDRVAIPPLRPKSVAAGTGRSHRFVRKGTLARLEIRVLFRREPAEEPDFASVEDEAPTEGDFDPEEPCGEGEPPAPVFVDEPSDGEQPLERPVEAVSNRRFILIVDGVHRADGQTDADGFVRAWVPSVARQGEIITSPGEEDELRIRLAFGGLDPLSEPTGVQQRLTNLGFACGPIDGRIEQRTRRAISQFQESCGSAPTGELDDQTRDTLRSVHGS